MTTHVARPTTGGPSDRRRELLLRLLQQRNESATDRAPRDATPATIEPDPTRRYDPFPLTEIQQAYWIGRSAAYEFGDVSIHAYVEVEGNDIDLPRLQRSWQRVVTRHDMLRAVVLPDGRQQILPEVPPYELRVADLRGETDTLVADALQDTRQELSHQVLEVEAWPGFDIRVTLLDEGHTRVHISIDLLHIDGGSLMILIDEWMQLYRNPHAVLAPLELSYRDYVLGEAATHQSETYRRSTAYWHDKVATLPMAPALPVVSQPGAAGQTRFRHRRTTLEPATWQRLKARAATAGLTPSALLLTAYADVLACWSQDDAFTLNVTLFNRLPLHSQVNRILGDFTSMILLEVAASPGTSFADRATTIQKDLWAGLDHRHVSGIQVLRELARAQKRTRGAPMPIVFTSMLDLAAQGFRPPFSSLHALGDVVHTVTQTPQVWLDHQVLEEDGALVLTWDAVEHIFAPGVLDDMFTAYERFLRGLADTDDAWLNHSRSHLPPEQLARRADTNATEVAVADDTLLTLFLRQADLRPEDPAVITSDRVLTYAETRRRANHLGHTLRRLGAQPNTLVAVVMDKGWEQPVGTLGVHLAGAAYVPIDPGLPAERRGSMLAHAQVRVVLTQSWLDRDLDWPADIRRICVDTTEPSTIDDTWLKPVQRPEDLSHVIYTSGSTGTPNGVMIEHRNVVNRIIDVNQRLGIGPHDRIFGLTALHHDLSVYDIFGVLAAGAAMVIPDAAGTRDPGHWARLMVREGVTMWNSVPAFLQMLVEYLEQRTDQPELVPDALRCAVLAGDWIPVTLPDRLRALIDGVQVIASGGPTETTIWDIWYPIGEVDPAWPSIHYGKPMNNTRYYVLNRALQPCPVWVAGQLHIAGTGLARGYWRDEAKTRERFITHPDTGERIYRSGDRGRRLPDGNIEFLGREDSQVKISGQRIELGEIEATLQQHPSLDAAVVTAVGEPKQLQRLVAYVVPKAGRAASVADVGTRPAPAGGKKLTEFEQRDLAGISVLDPVARIDFKLQQWGVRRDTDREAVTFPAGESDETLRRVFAQRHSVRNFSLGLLPSAGFGELLRSLTQIEMGGLAKYRYPSGGGLYPVQTYVYVKPDRVEGVAGGVYYHDPKGNRLLLMSPDARLDAGTQMPHNRAVFDKAAFVVFLVGQLAAVEPLYGGLARDFCLLEAGYMSQLLMSVAPAHRIGLCPIGAMDFDPIRPYFNLQQSQILVHLLFGGLDDDAARPSTVDDAVHPGDPAGATDDDLIVQLRSFLSRKLPAHMQPSAYVLLDELPLTPNGKVDRLLLPPLEDAFAPAQPPDAPPRSDAERMLATIAQEILGTPQVGVHQNFFDLGGTSIHMVQILNKVRVAFGREVPVTEIFRHPTVSSLAAYLDGEDTSAPTRTPSAERADQRRSSQARRDTRRRERPDSGERPASDGEEGVPR